MLRVAPTILVLAFVACGGKAIIDPGTNRGSGGAGGTPTVAVTDGSSTSSSFGITVTTSASTSTGMTEGFCDFACESLQACTFDLPNCVDRCNSVPEPCREAHQRWMSCSLGETNTMCEATGPGQVCQPDLLDYIMCANLSPGESCSVDPNGGCFCEGFISPGVLLEMDCGPEGCACLVGSQEVGFCEFPPGPAAAECSIVGGCCAGIFFTPPIN